MRRPRLTIAAMMVGVMYAAALVAAAVAARRDPSEATAGAASAIVLATFCLAALLAVVRRGRARGAWAGMAIFGLGYLAFAWSATGAPGPPTTPLVDRYWASTVKPARIGIGYDDGIPTISPRLSVERRATRQIGHAFLALPIGLAGSALGYVLAGRSSEGWG